MQFIQEPCSPMTRLLFLLSLTAVLSGPLLREAEGADHLSRSLAELRMQGQLETVDGGVGDDPGVVIAASKPSLPHDLSTRHQLSLEHLEPAGEFARPQSSVTGPSHTRQPRHLPDEFRGTPGLIAWLQRFLF
jgi:hypothetical protein